MTIEESNPRRWAVWRAGQLARNSGVLLVWMLLRAGSQAATVILLARSLGAESYGTFVAVIAVAGFVTPWVGLGLANIVLRNGARDPARLWAYYGRAFRVWLCSLVPGVVLVAGLAFLLLPPELPLLAMLSAMAVELSVTSLAELRGRQQQARHRLGVYGAINSGLPMLRLLVLGLLVSAVDNVTLTDVFWAYTLASLAYLLLLLHMSAADFASLPGALQDMSLHSGLSFCISTSAMRLQGEFNKPVLLHVGYGLAGSYNIAQRTIELVSLPLFAMQEALWPRLYAQEDPLRQLRRSGLGLMALAFLMGCVLWLIAPLLYWVVGEEYNEAVGVIRLLSWLPLIQVGRGLLNFQIIHQGRLVVIGVAYVLGAAVSVFGVLLFVPRFGVHGAALVSYAVELVLVLFLLVATSSLGAKTKRVDPYANN
ncbi:lipopolysaccharide biosynthesis protein [Stenotrophomonas sp.]|uniref:lipopolysaccharide biosynthesis protein n=1 Tax=Stenotrophomonas sp. TaxID=69392 RepID=UPI00289D7699|nr:lipopolysaccharide biosynthesis protein [Stenotrophomonas sp.]